MTPVESDGSATRTFGRFLAHRPDFVILALALPLFLALDWPIAAWGVVTVLWIAQFILQVVLDAKAASSTDPKRVMGLYMAGALARGWGVATALLITGLVDRETGLYAIVLTAVVFTSYFIAKLFGRLFDEADTVTEAQK
jgi:hypothetical protein